MIAQKEKRPVHQPAPLLQHHRRRCRRAAIDCVAQRVKVIQRRVPVAAEDLAGQLAPQCRERLLHVRRQKPVVGEQIGSHAIVAALEEKLGVLMEHLNLLRRDIELLTQVGCREATLTLELLHAADVTDDGEDGLDFCLQLLHLSQYVLTPRGDGLRHLSRPVQSLVDVAVEVEHIGLAEDRKLRALEVRLLEELTRAQKVEQRQQQVAVQELSDRRRQVVRGRGRGTLGHGA
mmetsp:Transcript_6598/g.17115  ORF Transcript_6598/g.17115 Transcript_6598/m.17115 type:complete len:233 (+) Transcript_6598:1151-1849(+)